MATNGLLIPDGWQWVGKVECPNCQAWMLFAERMDADGTPQGDQRCCMCAWDIPVPVPARTAQGEPS